MLIIEFYSTIKLLSTTATTILKESEFIERLKKIDNEFNEFLIL